ncbi:MAG: ferritin-like domain-containing protein [Thermoplasmatota archaeon]
MGTVGKEMVDMDVGELVKLLNRALADEWLAYYQYWIGAQVLEGPLRGEAEAELLEHAADELRHAQMLVDRIIQLGGMPLLTPEDWYEWTNCGYEAPTDPSVRRIVEQNIEGEQCAIRTYRKLVDLTKETDPVTYEMALEIMRDEIEHEDDLEAILDDMKHT